MARFPGNLVSSPLAAQKRLGRPEDLVLVITEDLNPVGDVGSMLFRVVGDAPFSGQKNTRQFSSKLLLGVVRIAEAVAFVERRAQQVRSASEELSKVRLSAPGM